MSRSRDTANTQENVGGAVAPFVAGKNKIINGDFGVWQRGTSFSGGGYSADRWFAIYDGSGATRTVTQQTFTPGTAPVAGYEGQFYFRYNVTVAGSGATYAIQEQRIEDVRTFAGQTITISFWAKADTARTLTLQPWQYFGSGGSADVYVTSQSASLTTSWQRFSFTYSIPNISGKTLATSSTFLGIRFLFSINTTQTVDLWGVQVEAGSVATPFTTATGTIQGELAACQRYCYSVNYTGGNKNGYNTYGTGRSTNSTSGLLCVVLPVPMRVAPSSVSWGGAIVFDDANSPAITALNVNQGGANVMLLNVTCGAGGLTAKQPAFAYSNNDGNAYMRFESEL